VLKKDRCLKMKGTPAANAAGALRRVIEGEGLGGFARRLTY
jgi:hypothetical protein